ncbi:hypothetical protein [Calycomorphotria hydatis]|nr:hypothetical protein [Calycomorphotria hydatis]
MYISNFAIFSFFLRQNVQQFVTSLTGKTVCSNTTIGLSILPVYRTVISLQATRLSLKSEFPHLYLTLVSLNIDYSFMSRWNDMIQVWNDLGIVLKCSDNRETLLKSAVISFSACCLLSWVYCELAVTYRDPYGRTFSNQGEIAHQFMTELYEGNNEPVDFRIVDLHPTELEDDQVENQSFRKPVEAERPPIFFDTHDATKLLNAYEFWKQHPGQSGFTIDDRVAPVIHNFGAISESYDPAIDAASCNLP